MFINHPTAAPKTADSSASQSSAHRVELPDVGALPSAQYARDGADLLVTFQGETVRIEDYFLAANPPQLVGADGVVIDPTWIAANTQAHVPSVEVAELAKTATGKTVIGRATLVVEGPAKAINQGKERELKIGDPIFLYDTLSTGSRTYLKITLKDGTVFQLGPSSRATLDAYDYQSSTKVSAATGEFEASIFSGVFRFISGAIGDDNQGQHSRLNTPSATIGIRGSEIDGQILQDGSTVILHTEGLIDIHPRYDLNTFTVFEPGTRVEIPASPAVTPSAFSAPPATIMEFRSFLAPLNNNFRPVQSDDDAEGHGFGRAAFGEGERGEPGEDEPREAEEERGEARGGDDGDHEGGERGEAPHTHEDRPESGDDEGEGYEGDGPFQTNMEAPERLETPDDAPDDPRPAPSYRAESEEPEYDSSPEGAPETSSRSARLDIPNTPESASEPEDEARLAPPSLSGEPEGAEPEFGLDSPHAEPEMEAPEVGEEGGGEGELPPENEILDNFPSPDEAPVFSGGPSAPSVPNDVDLVLEEDTEAFFDPEGLVVEVLHGADARVEITPEGLLVYIPNPDFHGSDSFSYTLDNGDTNTVSVAVLPVNDAPRGELLELQAFEDTPLLIDMGTLLNQGIDVDSEGFDLFSVEAVITPEGANLSRGQVAFDPETQFIEYRPAANFNGLAVVSYELVDEQGEVSAPALLEIQVLPVNDPPRLFTPELFFTSNAQSNMGNVSLDISLVELLGNAQDVEGDELFFDGLIVATADGDVELFEGAVNDAQGNVISLGRDDNGFVDALSFTPVLGFQGLSGFAYSISDEAGDNAVGLVEILVNSDPNLDISDMPGETDASETLMGPQLQDESFDLFGRELVLSADELLANDVDAQGTGLILLDVGQGVNGTVEVFHDADGLIETVVFHIDDNAAEGGFSYVVINENGEEAQAQVFVTAAEQQFEPTEPDPDAGTPDMGDAPLLGLDRVTVPKASSASVSIDALLANDSDPSGGVLDFVGIENVQGGNAELNGDLITFVPNEEFALVGGGSLQYRVENEVGLDSLGQVLFLPEIDNLRPHANADRVPATISFFDSNIVAIDPIPFSVLVANDDDPDGDDFAVVGVENMRGGMAHVDFDQDVILFDPDDNFDANSGFNYIIEDERGALASGRVSFDIEVLDSHSEDNQAPIAQDDIFSAPFPPAEPIRFPQAVLLENDSDPEGGTLFITEVHSPQQGQVLIDTNNGDIVFVPSSAFFFEAQGGAFEYVLMDIEGAESTATVVLEHLPPPNPNDPNSPPIDPVEPPPDNLDGVMAVDDTFSTPFGESIEFNIIALLENDRNPNDDFLSFEGISQVELGRIEQVDAEHFAFIPDPDLQDTGEPQTARFTYHIVDEQGNASSAEVRIDLISAVIPPPTDPEPTDPEPITSVDNFDYPSAGDTLLFTMDAEPQAIAPNANASGIAFFSKAEPSALRIGINGAEAQDQLFIKKVKGIDLQGTAISYEGLQFAELLSTEPSLLIVELSPDASAEAVSTLLQAVHYDYDTSNQTASDATLNARSASFALFTNADAAFAADSEALIASSATRPIEVQPTATPDGAQDDRLDIPFNASFLIPTEDLLSNDQGDGLNIVDVFNLGAGVTASLETDGIEIFVDAQEAIASDGNAAVSLDYAATDSAGVRSEAHVDLVANNVKLGDANNNSFEGGDEIDILVGAGGRDFLLGNGGDDLLLGGAGDDALDGGTGRNVVLGNEGDDDIALHAGSAGSFIDGGSGVDKLNIQGTNQVLDLINNQSLAAEERISLESIDVVNLFADGNAENQLVLSVSDVLSINEAGRLFVEGDASSVVSSEDQGWEKLGEVEENGGFYFQYQVSTSSGEANLLVNTEITSQLIF